MRMVDLERKNMKRFLIFLIFAGVIATVAVAEQVQFSTYIPAPLGKYDRIHLVPRADLSEPCEIGVMYVNTSGELRYCQDDGGGNGSFGETAEGAWKQEGNNIFPKDTDTNPNISVGIGTSTPGTFLHVVSNQSGRNSVLELENTENDLDFFISSVTPEGPDRRKHR